MLKTVSKGAMRKERRDMMLLSHTLTSWRRRLKKKMLRRLAVQGLEGREISENHQSYCTTPD